MPLEMAEHDHTVGSSDIAGNRYLRKMFLLDLHPADILPVQPIGYNDRCSCHRIIEPMKDRCSDMLHGIRTGTPVERIGIGQERQGAHAFTFSTT